MKRLNLFLIFLLVTSVGFSQFFKDQKHITKHKGYFNFYYDDKSDKVYLEVDKLDTEFLYMHALSEGVGSNDIGLDRGQLGDGVVVKFIKAGNKLLLIQPNQDYRAITSNAEEKQSVKEAFAKSVLFGATIKETKGKKYVIDISNFLMRDAHGVVSRLKNNGQGNYALDKSKSAFYLPRTKGFPKNVEFDVMLTYAGNAKAYQIRSVTPNSSLVTVHQHHSFIELPDANYKPRKYDPRCGSWQTTYMDYATPVNQPIVKRFITRHRLEKKNPSAAISEAKAPIVYYLDRGTPEPIRSALLEGGRWWNQAFEAIGYKDAFQLKILPKDADPLDIRYNMVQWVHRSTRGWSYGGSITDPRTGEILKGHVSLGSLRIRQDFMIAQALQAPYKTNTAEDKFALDMALARIRQLSAHEIGHTLGFAHNFAASTNNRASVMDYPHPTLSIKNGKIDFSNAYATGIGEWDKVTVAYAYQDFVGNEASQLNKILEDAFAKGLRFISDADARPKGSAHAYAHLWDNGSNAARELESVLAVRKQAIADFSIDNIPVGQPYSVLEDVFVPVYFFHRYQTDATSKLIAGLDYTYAVKGQKETVVKTINVQEQKEALKALLQTISAENLTIPKRLLNLFPPRAYGYGRTRESFKSKAGVAFDIYGGAQTATEFTLSFLLHPERANRLVQQKSLDAKQLGLDEVLDALIKVSFETKYKDTYQQAVQEVIKEEVLLAMFGLANSKAVYPQVKAKVLSKIDAIAKGIDKDFFKRFNQISLVKQVTSVLKIEASEMDNHFLNQILKFKTNPQQFKETKVLKIPDGSPIGTDGCFYLD